MPLADRLYITPRGARAGGRRAASRRSIRRSGKSSTSPTVRAPTRGQRRIPRQGLSNARLARTLIGRDALPYIGRQYEQSAERWQMPWDNNTGGGGRNSIVAVPGDRPRAAAAAAVAAPRRQYPESRRHPVARPRPVPGRASRRALGDRRRRCWRCWCSGASIRSTRSIRRKSASNCVRQAEDRADRAGPAFPSVADRERRARQRHREPDRDRLGSPTAAPAATRA